MRPRLGGRFGYRPCGADGFCPFGGAQGGEHQGLLAGVVVVQPILPLIEGDLRDLAAEADQDDADLGALQLLPAQLRALPAQQLPEQRQIPVGEIPDGERLPGGCRLSQKTVGGLRLRGLRGIRHFGLRVGRCQHGRGGLLGGFLQDGLLRFRLRFLRGGVLRYGALLGRTAIGGFLGGKGRLLIGGGAELAAGGGALGKGHAQIHAHNHGGHRRGGQHAAQNGGEAVLLPDLLPADIGHDIFPQIQGSLLQIPADLPGDGGKSLKQRCAFRAAFDMLGQIGLFSGCQLAVDHAADQLLIAFTRAHGTSLPLGFLDEMESGMFPSFSK